MKDRPRSFRLLSVCDVIGASAVRDHLHLLGVSPEEQRLLPELAAELKSREDRLLDDPRDLSRMAEVIAEVAAGTSSTEQLEALSALLYIAAAFTEEDPEQRQRVAWDRIFHESNWQVGFDSLDLPSPVRRAVDITRRAYRIQTDRLSRLLQDADARWIAEGQATLAPEHQVDTFLGLAGRRYFLEAARIIRYVTTDDQVEAIERMATRLAGFDLRLP